MWLLLLMDHYLSPTGTILFSEAAPPQMPRKGEFIVLPQGQMLIRSSPTDMSTVSGAIEALKNPNPETHYLAFQKLIEAGPKALSEVRQMWQSETDVFRARALWILAKLDSSDAFLQRALTDRNVDIRIAAVRAVAQNKSNVVPYLSSVVRDENAAVRREVAQSPCVTIQLRMQQIYGLN